MELLERQADALAEDLAAYRRWLHADEQQILAATARLATTERACLRLGLSLRMIRAHRGRFALSDVRHRGPGRTAPPVRPAMGAVRTRPLSSERGEGRAAPTHPPAGEDSP